MHRSTAAFKRGLWISALLLAVMDSGCATHNTVNDGDDRRLMLKGHDPVACFTLGRPAPGNPAIEADFDGATYRFMNEENRAQFVKNPAKYQPQYNGFCANGVVYAIALGGNSRKYFEMDKERNVRLADG